IRGLRQREWVRRLPRAIRDELARLPADKRVARLEQLHKQEEYHRVLWQRPMDKANAPIPHPAKPSDLPRETQTFLEQEILPRLNEEERKSLKQAEGTWPSYPRQVALLADSHPTLPEGPLGKIITTAQLPASVRERLERNRNKNKPWTRNEGKWPDF